VAALHVRRNNGQRTQAENNNTGRKMITNNSSEHTELLTTEQLRVNWEKIRSDPDAHSALERLNEAGFRISHLKPNDATFKYPTWADYIAALPLVPNKTSTRRIHSKIRFRKYWPLVQELRVFAAKWNTWPFAVEILSERDYPLPALRKVQDDLLKTATMLEHFLSWDYSIRTPNVRHALIAALRWTIRQRTGKPHDSELNVLIDVSFRAAGFKEGCYIDPTTLDRIEKRQKENRIKAHQRIRDLNNTASPSIRRSTRNRRKSRKRV
jgi:hypothetical protein